MLIAIVPVIAIVVGIFVFTISKNPVIQEVMRALFWGGIFVVLYLLSHATVTIGR